MFSDTPGYGFQIRKWGDTCCGGVCNFSRKAFTSPGGLPNCGSQLKSGHAYSLVIFFDCEFFEIT